MEELLRELIQTVQEIAPEMWGYLVTQAKLEAGRYMIIAAVLATLAVFAFAVTRTAWDEYKQVLKARRKEAEERYPGDYFARIRAERQAAKETSDFGVVAFAVGVAATLGTVGLLWCGIARLVNPGYYAIKMILEAVQ